MEANGVIIKEVRGRIFSFRLILHDRKTRPDIWRKNPDGQWVMLVAAANAEDIQRYF